MKFCLVRGGRADSHMQKGQNGISSTLLKSDSSMTPKRTGQYFFHHRALDEKGIPILMNLIIGVIDRIMEI